jgi:hypothetical protein
MRLYAIPGWVLNGPIRISKFNSHTAPHVCERPRLKLHAPTFLLIGAKLRRSRHAALPDDHTKGTAHIQRQTLSLRPAHCAIEVQELERH